MQKGECFFEEKNNLAFGIYLFVWFHSGSVFFCVCRHKETKIERKKT